MICANEEQVSFINFFSQKLYYIYRGCNFLYIFAKNIKDMTTTDIHTTEPVKAPAVTETTGNSPRQDPGPTAGYRVALAVVAAVLTLVAWLAAMWVNGYISIGIAVVAIACGAMGCTRRAGAWRNLGITAIIASGILAIVMAAFLIAMSFI